MALASCPDDTVGEIRGVSSVAGCGNCWTREMRLGGLSTVFCGRGHCDATNLALGRTGLEMYGR